MTSTSTTTTTATITDTVKQLMDDFPIKVNNAIHSMDSEWFLGMQQQKPPRKNLNNINKAIQSKNPQDVIRTSGLSSNGFIALENLSLDTNVRTVLEKLNELLTNGHLSFSVARDVHPKIDGGDELKIVSIDDLSQVKRGIDSSCYDEVLKFTQELLRSHLVTGIIVIKWVESRLKKGFYVPVKVPLDEVDIHLIELFNPEDLTWDKDIIAISKEVDAASFRRNVKNSLKLSHRTNLPRETPYHVFNLNGDGFDISSLLQSSSDVVMSIKELTGKLDDLILEEREGEIWVQREPISQQKKAASMRDQLIDPTTNQTPINDYGIRKLSIRKDWDLAKEDQSRLRQQLEDDEHIKDEMGIGWCDDNMKSVMDVRKGIREAKRSKRPSNITFVSDDLKITRDRETSEIAPRLIHEIRELITDKKNTLALLFGLPKNFFTQRSSEMYAKTADSHKRDRMILSSRMQEMVSRSLNKIFSFFEPSIGPSIINIIVDLVKEIILPEGYNRIVDLPSEEEQAFYKEEVETIVRDLNNIYIKAEYVGSGTTDFPTILMLYNSGLIKYEPFVEACSKITGLGVSSFKSEDEFDQEQQQPPLKRRALLDNEERTSITEDNQEPPRLTRDSLRLPQPK